MKVASQRTFNGFFDFFSLNSLRRQTIKEMPQYKIVV